MCLINTKNGNISIAINNKGIYKIDLRARLRKKATVNKQTNKNVKHIEFLFKSYLEGKKTSFDIKYDISHLPEFTQKVLRETKKIPYGKTITYGEIAQKIGHPKASRAVGQALGLNPLPILIPCHRVIRKDKTLGRFAFGLKWKKFLLSLENK